MNDLTKRTLPPSGLPEQMSSPEQAEAYYRRVNRTGMPIRVQRASSVITALSMTCVLYVTFKSRPRLLRALSHLR